MRSGVSPRPLSAHAQDMSCILGRCCVSGADLARAPTAVGHLRGAHSDGGVRMKVPDGAGLTPTLFARQPNIALYLPPPLSPRGPQTTRWKFFMKLVIITVIKLFAYFESPQVH